jgi:hypothetical protein
MDLFHYHSMNPRKQPSDVSVFAQLQKFLTKFQSTPLPSKKTISEAPSTPMEKLVMTVDM